MNRYQYAAAIAALALLASPALAVEPNPEALNQPSPSDTMADDLNAKQLRQVEQEQERLKKEIEEKNAKAMEEWRRQNEERYREWKKQHPEAP
jgi:hypothetical protein